MRPSELDRESGPRAIPSTAFLAGPTLENQVGAPSPRSDLRDNPQMALQRAFYGISYRLGRLPWDTGISPP
ncbi:MAG: hypothetical protein WB867_01235, partial [Candidatus Dormiibacterota bacterium]